mmetsp:Transcript_567/g.1246  ORF Transcript_567/g.1246 Transcript_567/m.1246 type:complete len:202 (+) Transcript_567:398-1003(+)
MRCSRFPVSNRRRTDASQFRLGPIPEAEPVVAVSQRVLGEVFLVLVVGRIEGGVVDDRRLHRLLVVGLDVPRVDVPLELRLDFFGDRRLLRRRAKDDAPVLRPSVVSLRVERGRVVKGVKKPHQVLEDFRRLRGLLSQLDVEDLDVARPAAADLTVGGILHPVRVRVHEADLGVGDAPRVLLLEVLDDELFGPPVAACSEC